MSAIISTAWHPKSPGPHMKKRLNYENITKIKHMGKRTLWMACTYTETEIKKFGTVGKMEEHKNSSYLREGQQNTCMQQFKNTVV